MKIGENGIIVFKMYDLDMTAVDKVIFTFRGIEKLEKDYPSASVNYADGRFYVGLTQEDTLILSQSRRVKVQAEAQICFTNGSVAKSDTIDFLLNDTLNTNVIPGNAPSDFVNEIEFHYEKGIIIIGGSGITEQRVREIISGYHFVTSDALNDYVTLSSLNARLNDYVTKNGLNDAIATYVDENVDLSQYATKDELEDYAEKSSLDNYATKTELNDYATKTELGDYATETDVETALADKQDKTQFSTMPTASADLVGKIYQFVGETSANFTKGLFYECVEVTPSTTPKTYTWVAKATDVVVDAQLDSTSQNAIANSVVAEALQMKATQLSTLPTASANYLGKIVQYVGATNATYIHGYFYECVSDGAATPAYSWSNTSVGSGGEMETMTQEEMLDILNGGD